MERWEKIKAVQRMQDYIEEHVAEEITLYNLAQAAGYSPWHAARMFKELTGKPPVEYIRARRLSQAAVKLTEKTRILDVALDFFFASHEGFTRAFSKQFGMTPRQYCKEAPALNLFLPDRVRDYYLKMQLGGGNMTQKSNINTVFVQVVDRPARKLILKRGIRATHYFEYASRAPQSMPRAWKSRQIMRAKSPKALK